MFSLFKKTRFSVRVKTYQTPRYVAGMGTVTGKKTFRREVPPLQKSFYQRRETLAQRSAPSGTLVFSGRPGEDGRFSYFLGDFVDTPQQPEGFTVLTLEEGEYAHITVDFKVENHLVLQVAKAKMYFFESWLPSSGYRMRGEFESIELYDRRSSIQLPSVDLIFPLERV